MRAIRLAAALVLAGLAGCTTSLETRPTYAVSSPGKALPDHGYRLPMLQYDVIVAYKLVSCPGFTDANGKPTKLAFKVEAIAASEHVAGEAYTVDYSALSSPLKVTDFAIEAYPETGTLKSINASAEDKTGDFLKSAIEFGISGASLVAGNPLPSLGAAHSTGDVAGQEADKLLAGAEMINSLTCTNAAVTTLQAAEAARNEIKRLSALIAPDVKQLEHITMRATVKLSDAGDAARLIAIHDRQQINLDLLDQEKEKLTDLEKELTFLDNRSWPVSHVSTEGPIGLSGDLRLWLEKLVTPQLLPNKSNIFDPDLLAANFAEASKNWPPPQAEQVRKILDETLALQAAGDLDGQCPKQPVADCVAARLGVYAELLSEAPPVDDCAGKVGGYRRECRSDTGAVDARANVAHKGIFFRQPLRARLLLCDRGRTCRTGDREALLRTGWDVAPQLGQLRFVPLSNGPFQNNTLSLAIREDGTLIKFQYAEKSAVLAQAIASAAGAATKLDEERAARKKERREALKEYRDDLTYQRTETAAVRTEAAAVRTDEIAQIQYDIDKLTKEKSLLDLRFPPAKDDPVVSKEYANETTRLEAMATQLRWRLAVKEAEEALAKK